MVQNSQTIKSRNLINAMQVAIEIITSIAEKISVDHPVDEAQEQGDGEMLDESKEDDDEEFYIQRSRLSTTTRWTPSLQTLRSSQTTPWSLFSLSS